MPQYGATREQWAHWSLILGLTEDLLPVVSNPGAQIAGESTLKTIGKVPSRYNARGLVVGIKDWTSRRSTAADIDVWSRKDDYGICLQTRSIRCLDLDLDSVTRASEVRGRIADLLGVLPARLRPGSARLALAFRLPDQALAKRVITLSGGGAIELLASGQQFVISGQHPSGGRYFWEGGDPDTIPTVTPEQLDACWRALDREFGDGSWVAGGSGPTRALAASAAGVLGRLNGVNRTGVDDPVAAWLAGRGWVVGEDEKKLWVACPWSEEHTVDTGGSSTCWFVAGTGGYEQGHFECLHAHCARRGDREFLEAVGYEQSFVEDFGEIVPLLDARVDGRGVADPALDARGSAGAVGVDSGSAGGALVAVADPTIEWDSAGPGRGITKVKSRGRVMREATAVNLARALAWPGWWRRIQFDSFKQELFWSAWSGEGGLQPWTSDDFFKAREQLELAQFMPMSKELLRDAIYRVGRADGFDSAQQWLGGLVWDGVDRVSGAMARYFGAADDEYGQEVGRYQWTAAAGRVLDPGCKADMVIILQSNVEGHGKSSGVEALVPRREFYTTVDLTERDDNLTRCLQGVMVAEWPELRGLRSRASEAVKGWITQRADRFVPKYENAAVTVQRRHILIGTTNEVGFLPEGAGRRRWLPIRVLQADLEALERDRDQLWAQGAAMFAAGGVAWERVQILAAGEYEQWAEEEMGLEKVALWIEENPAEYYRTEEILTQAMGSDLRNGRNYMEKQAARIMRKLGWNQFVRRINSRNSKIWLLLRH